MRKFTPQLLVALLAIVGFGTTFNIATAQDTSQLPQVIEKPVDGPPTIRLTQKRVEGLRNMILLNDPNSLKAVRKIELGKFWIGLNCAEVSPALRSQLNLKDGIGLLVVKAFEGSPSQKAGLKQHDVVVKAGDKDIGEVGQLIEAVQKAGDSELKLEIIREGQPKTITVKSAERSKALQGDPAYLPATNGEHRLLFRTPQGALTFLEPGVVLDNQFTWVQAQTIDRKLPAGVSITITRQAGKEVSIHVEQNDKSWDITPGQLEQLPKELRPHVQSMLAPAMAAPTQMRTYSPQHSPGYRQIKPVFPTPQPEVQIFRIPKFTLLDNAHSGAREKATPVESEIEKLKRELSEEMKQLRKAIDELKKSNESK